MTRTPIASRRPLRQSGVSLIELMISMAIGLFLMGAVALLYVSTSTNSKSTTLESQMNEDASIAMEVLQKQIRLAGFSNINATGERKFSGIAVRGCDAGFVASTPPTAPSDFNSLTCGTSGSDALAIRYEATTLNTQPIDVSGTPNPSNCAYEGVAEWDHDGDVATPAIALADDRYYIANDTDGAPTLFCQGRTGAGFGTATALIPNIESMQVEYGVTLAPTAGDPPPQQITGYVKASNAILTDPASLKGWERVAVVNICLVARSSQVVPGGDVDRATTGRYLDCTGTQKTPTDGYLRRAYQTTVQLRNMRPAVPLAYAAGDNPWASLDE